MGVCKWCGELVEGPEVRPYLVVCDSREQTGVSIARRAHWLKEPVRIPDEKPDLKKAA